MAGRFHYMLPLLNVAMRSTSGKLSEKYISRGFSSQHHQLQQQNMVMEEEQSINSDDLPEEVGRYEKVLGNLLEDEKLPSLHEISQKQATESWNKIRPELLKTAVASEAMRRDQKC